MFQITYTMPNQPTITERGLTKDGADLLMNVVLRNGGTGCRQTARGVKAAQQLAKDVRAIDMAVKARFYYRIQHGT